MIGLEQHYVSHRGHGRRSDQVEETAGNKQMSRVHRLGLVDEYWLAVQPVVVGQGRTVV
jgi:hypothetical protein